MDTMHAHFILREWETIMFELNGRYANRKGDYIVVAINTPKMTVRYDDGSEATLNMDIQERIWENILAEHEPRRSTRTGRRPHRVAKIQHFIKVVSVPANDEMAFPGWQERVVLLGTDLNASPALKSGDRLIYYVLETQQFIAVVTITGTPNERDPKDYFFTIDADKAYFLPVDIDASAPNPENGVAVESIEMESQPNFGQAALSVEDYVPINEDDFELLAEILTEISEDEEDDDDDEDIEFEEEDEE